MSSKKRKQPAWFAYIFEPDLKKKRIVPTSSIYQFDLGNYDAQKEKYTKKTDKVIEEDGKKRNCQVLMLAETKMELEEKIKRKRPHVPKLNASAFDESLQLESDDEAQNAAKKRKINREDCKKSSQETNNSIVAAHIATSKNKFQRTDDKKSSKKELVINLSDNNKFDCTKAVYDGVKNDKVSIEKDEELNEYESKLEAAENNVAYWRDKYIQLVSARKYNLTEKTGQEIIEVLNCVKRNLGDFSEGSVDNIAKSAKPSMTKIGYNVSISTATYDELMRETECGPFITSTSYAVWGVENLAARTVRPQRNVTEKRLTPEKKSAVVSLFEVWLKKRGMPETFIIEQTERKRLNKYFNGAVSAARKKIKYPIKHGDKNENKNKDGSQKKQTQNNEKKENNAEDDNAENKEDDDREGEKDNESDENEIEKNNDESQEVNDNEEENENNESCEDYGGESDHDDN